MWPFLVKTVTVTEENEMNVFYLTLWLQVKYANIHIWEKKKYKQTV